MSQFSIFERVVGCQKTTKHGVAEQDVSQGKNAVEYFENYSSMWGNYWNLPGIKEFCILQYFLWRVISHHLKDPINFYYSLSCMKPYK